MVKSIMESYKQHNGFEFSLLVLRIASYKEMENLESILKTKYTGLYASDMLKEYIFNKKNYFFV